MLLYTPIGQVHLSERVISKLAGSAVSSTKDITMNAGFVEGVYNRVMGKKMAGIQVNASDTMVSIEIRIILRYGENIHMVCKEVQRNVRDVVEYFGGITVTSVNICVEGLTIS